MHRLPLFSFGEWLSIYIPEQERHIIRQRAHRLHTFRIQGCLSFLASVNDIPILGCYHRHIHHHKWHVQRLERGRGTSSAAYSYSCSRFIAIILSCGEEHSLHERQDRSVGLAVIDRRTNDERVCRSHFLVDAVAQIVIEDASVVVLYFALPARNTSARRTVAYLNDLRLDVMFRELLSYFRKRKEGVATLPCATID